MSDTSKTFRVFVSSTFNDLKAERNALQAYVFPRLRELCEAHQARFQPIDLRWGVSNEASLDQQAMQICLDEIDRCKDVSPRPNFIVLLGDRYGWLPPRARIPQSEFEIILAAVTPADRAFLKDWYQLDRNALPPEYRLKPRKAGGEFEPYENWMVIETRLHQILADAVESLPFSAAQKAPYQASATHQEIIAGALTQTNAREHVFCFLRNISGLPQSFDLNAFLAVLSHRLARKYPQGLNQSAQSILDGIRALAPETSAGDLQSQLTALAPTAEASEFVQFIQQALDDFLGKNYINFDESDLEIDRAAHDRLKALKDQLESEFGRHLFKAEAVEWLGDQVPASGETYNCIREEHIGRLPARLKECLPLLAADHQPQNLCEATFQHLGRVIMAELEKSTGDNASKPDFPHFRADKALDAEGLSHLAFAEERIQHFVGREAILSDIDAYLRSNTDSLLVIAGEGGSGKSALMAKALANAQTSFPDRQILSRFIGATPGSSDGRTLLESICRELARRYGEDENAVPSDFQSLRTEFNKMLSLATPGNPLILFLDSLDQLLDNEGVRELNWLPFAAPENVAIVLSTRIKEDTFANLEPKNCIRKPLRGLGELDGEALLDLWLGDVHRTLQPIQRQEVLKKFRRSGGNPLYLRLAFEEARLWRSYSPPENLAVGVQEIIRRNMLDRLADEGNHGEVLVSHALGYLAASRFGLAEDELVDLLSRDPDVYEWFFNQTYHLPSDLVALAAQHLESHPDLARHITQESHLEGEQLAAAWLKQQQTPTEPVGAFLREVIQRENGPRLPIVLWSRLSFDLAPYLTTRQVDDSALMTFYHRELGDVANDEYLTREQSAAYHTKLANYFQSKADPLGDRSWLGASPHALSELPYHLTESWQRDALFRTLTDFAYLEQKAEKVGITERMDENGAKTVTSDGVHQLEQDFAYALDNLYAGAGGAAEKSPVIITAFDTANGFIIYCPFCDTHSYISGTHLGGVVTCPNDECWARLKLNPFVIEAKNA
ncbi:DUF4062 domain-containing protein [bacterium]|nr:DUF4062 domain-containing protein [bacterium]